MTITEVAKLAGVSTATVSRVINRSPRVTPDVARSVLETIERIGYTPAARRPGPKLKGRAFIRTGNVLLLVMGMGPSAGHRVAGYPALMTGIEKAIYDHQLKLILAGLGEERVPTALDPGEVDGVLLFGKTEVLSNVARKRLEALPVVGVMRGFDEFTGKMDRVVYDNAAVGPMAARFLIGRGHRHLAFFNTDSQHPAFIVRQRDFTAVAAQAGVAVTNIVSDITPEGGSRDETFVYQAMVDRLLMASPRPTGIFAAGTYQIPGLYNWLEARGVAPADFDLIGSDTVPQFHEHFSPRPAMIDINLELVGYKAVEQLLWRMSMPEEKNHIKVQIEPVLVPGEQVFPK